MALRFSSLKIMFKDYGKAPDSAIHNIRHCADLPIYLMQTAVPIP